MKASQSKHLLQILYAIKYNSVLGSGKMENFRSLQADDGYLPLNFLKNILNVYKYAEVLEPELAMYKIRI